MSGAPKIPKDPASRRRSQSQIYCSCPLLSCGPHRSRFRRISLCGRIMHIVGYGRALWAEGLFSLDGHFVGRCG